MQAYSWLRMPTLSGRRTVAYKLPPQLDRDPLSANSLSMACCGVRPLVERLIAASWPLFMAPEDTWYQTGGTKVGVSQFLVQDPDGYLIRFSSRLGNVSPVLAEPPCPDPAGER